MTNTKKWPQQFVVAITFLFLMYDTTWAASPIRSEKTLTLEAALSIAQKALKASHDNAAHNIGIAVVDSAARPLVVLRDDRATQHPVTAAERKAWTAANYRNSTKDLLARIKKDKGDDGQLVYTDESLFLMGGVPIKDGNDVVGAIGVAGNPSGFQDHDVAKKAADTFTQLLKNNIP